MIHVSMAASFIYWTIGSKYFLGIYIFVYLCIYLFIYLFTFLHVYIFLYICVLMYLLIHLSIYIFTCLCIFIHLCIHLFSYILCVYIFLHIMYSFIYPCMSNFYDFLMLDICLLWFANFEGTGIVADISSLQLTAINVPGMSQSVDITPSNHTDVCLCSLSYIRIPGIGQAWLFLNTWRIWH